MDLFEAILWLAMNVYHESRSEGVMGMKAVAHVTINRAANRQLTIKEVVLQPKQFSWVHLRKTYVPDDWVALTACIKAASEAVNEPDFTAGATHYHLDTVTPEWSYHIPYIGKYGSHLFYRDGPIPVFKAVKKKIIKTVKEE